MIHQVHSFQFLIRVPGNAGWIKTLTVESQKKKSQRYAIYVLKRSTISSLSIQSPICIYLDG